MQTISGKAGKAGRARAVEDLRVLPSVSRILESPAFRRVAKRWGADLSGAILREEIARLRGEILAGRLKGTAPRRSVPAPALARRVGEAIAALSAPAPRVVINATGIVVHTNLGRSVLSDEAARRVADAATSYLDLEYDLGRGRRGSRLDHLEPLMARLFPGSAFVVVNNNAAAILLTLRALARRKEVIVSRGELVEIGGSFRVPDILAASGARLMEVGTTNRTRLSDYEQALSAKTGALLKVHTSNFRVVGFTGDVSVKVLAELARNRSIPLVVDWGSGDLVDLGPLGIHDELPVRRLLDDGADVVTFSGDKLLGGPQAGFVVGSGEWIARIRRDPLARVCRVDRLLIGALRETLASYVRGTAFDDVPTLSMLRLSARAIGRRAGRVRSAVAARTSAGARLSVVDGVSKTGGGSSPLGERPTRLLEVSASGDDAGRLERALRRGDPPVIARLHEGRLLLDLRTVLESQEAVLVERLVEVLLADAGRDTRR
jgi:L-seryl-tRNA(Ser) seleniumtransferase